MAELGKRVRKHRKELGLTQMELAERAGLHRTYIADIERGSRNVSMINLCTIATALGVHLPELLIGMNTRLTGKEKTGEGEK